MVPLVSGGGIRTRNFLDMSLLPLAQGSSSDLFLPFLITIFELSKIPLYL